ncbi:MAG: GNAT family N-acetyltransferase [Candidatus Lokiarchaeota archaeon]|nr:GNAT family N-acetyltransferase [Candidatus Lokiarchaeota archaeon]
MIVKKISKAELDFIPTICLDPSVGKESIAEMQKGMSDRLVWIKKMMEIGLEIFVALEEPKNEEIHYKWAGKMLHSDLAVNGQVPMGLLECVPIECAIEPIKGENSLFINCIWILPPFWGKGVGKALIEYLITRAKDIGGVSTIAYEGDKWCGTSINYMPFEFFKKFGLKEIERDGSRVLLHLDLGAENPPKLIYPQYENLQNERDNCLVAFYNSQCPWSKLMIDDLNKNIEENPNLQFKAIKTDNREIIQKYGISRGLIIEGKPIIKRIALWNEMQKEIKKLLK